MLLAGAAWVLARKVYRKPPLETISSNPPTQDPESGKMKGAALAHALVAVGLLLRR